MDDTGEVDAIEERGTLVVEGLVGVMLFILETQQG
jgi:hypothetical protein